MPIYEYRCTNCGAEYEVVCSVKEKEEMKPKCNCDDPYIKQVIKSINVRKGPGWGPGKGYWILSLIGGAAWLVQSLDIIL